MSTVMQVLVQEFKGKLLALNETKKLTQELEQCLKNNDKVTTELMLKMRAEELTKMGMYRKNIDKNARKMDLADGVRMKKLLIHGSKEIISEDLSEEWKQIIHYQQLFEKMLEDTIELDRKISNKIAGEKSYYK